MNPSPAVPVDRYRRPGGPGTRRRRLVAAVVGGAVVVGLGVWVGRGLLTEPVQWQDVGYHVHGSSSVDVTFEVTMAPGATASCRVRALSQSFAEVGVLDVAVPASSARTQRLTVTVPTSELAVTGTVQTCDVVTR